MASIVEKKFEWFEQHLRENLKEHTLASSSYIGIPKAEDDIFMVFYLRVLLDKLDKQKTASMASVPDSDRAEPRLGYRTSVPVPKGGISAIKIGEAPKFDLDEMIENTLTKAIKDYLAAAATSPNLTRELANNTDLITITRTELSNLEKPLMASYSFVKKIFHISDYLHSSNAKFITNRIIDNIKSLHEHCIADTLKTRFPEEQTESYVYLNPSDWLSVRLGIIPLGVYPDIPSEEEIPGIMNKFRDGNAAQYVVTEFSLSPISEFKGLIENLYNAAYDSLAEIGAGALGNIIDPTLRIHDYHKNTLLNILGYGDFIKPDIIKDIDENCCKTFYSVSFATSLYTAGVSDEDGAIPPIAELFEMNPSAEGNSLSGAFDSLVGSFISSDDGEIIVKETETSQDGTETVITDMTDTYYKRLADINDAYYYIRGYMERLYTVSKRNSDIWQNDSLQEYFDDSWFNSFLNSLESSLNNFKEDGNEAISKAKITSDKLENLRDVFHDFFNSVSSITSKMVSDFRNALDTFESEKDSIYTNVDAEFIENVFGTIGDYSIKEYNGTIICYKNT